MSGESTPPESLVPKADRRSVIALGGLGISAVALPSAARATSASDVSPSGDGLASAAISSAVPDGYRLSEGADTNGAIQVSWSSVSGATSYQVKYRTPSGSGEYTTFGSSTSSNSLRVTGLSGASTYDVVVVASNGTASSESVAVNDVKSIVATGGTVTSYEVSGARQVVHTFTSEASTFTLNRVRLLSYLVVGGGGGGGTRHGGGGGAGGFRSGGFEAYDETVLGEFAITVGSGGAGASIPAGTDNPTPATKGGDSSIVKTGLTTVTATGGGFGGSYTNESPSKKDGGDGGSGGGAAVGDTVGNSGEPGSGNTPATTPSQGNNGGAANPSQWPGTGGGGAGGTGGSNPDGNTGGAGGTGSASSITGSSVLYAGGGGGGGSSSGGSGGSGGGGAGATLNANGTSGTNGLGGGGGGARADDPRGTAVGGNGGSGVVILSYQLGDDNPQVGV